MLETNKTVTFSLPEELLELVEKVRRARKDPTRSDTVRFLLLHALASMSFLSSEAKRALGLAWIGETNDRGELIAAKPGEG